MIIEVRDSLTTPCSLSDRNHWLLSPYELKLSRLEDIRYAGSEERVAAVTIWMANGE